MLPAVKRVIGRSPSKNPNGPFDKGLLVKRDRLKFLTNQKVIFKTYF